MVKEISTYMLPLLLIFPIAQLTSATPPQVLTVSTSGLSH